MAQLTGTMNNTLIGQDVLNSAQSQDVAEQLRLQQATQAATQAAQTAAQQYQQAAAAPVPQLSPSDTFIPTLFSNVASVLGGTPSYRENQQQNVQHQKQEILQSRSDNLQALRDRYLQAAKSAADANDAETEIKNRTKYETLTKQIDQIRNEQFRAQITQAGEDRRNRQDALQALAGYYITAGKDVPPELLKKMQELGIAPASGGLPGAAKAGPASITSLTPGEYAVQKRLITSKGLLGKGATKETAGNVVTQLKQFVTGNRLRSEATPDQMAKRLDRFNLELANTQRKTGGFFKSTGSAAADTLSTDEKIQALYANFPADSVDNYLQKQGAVATQEGPKVAATKPGALLAVRAGDANKLRQILNDNPQLQTDTEIVAAVKAAKAAGKLQ